MKTADLDTEPVEIGRSCTDAPVRAPFIRQADEAGTFRRGR
jgi:hypothetical protein